MKKKIRISDRRKKILVFWYQYHKDTNLWPSVREAELELDIHYRTIHQNINVLIEAGWMVKKRHQIGLTKSGESSLIEAELIATGKMKRNINRISHMKKKHE